MNRLLNRLFRAAPIVLALYWTALFISTHYPLNVPLEAAWRHTDKLLHFAAFFGLAVLCAAAWTWRIRLAARHHLLLLAGLLVYAAVDEGLQAIPTFQRSANLADFAANVAGVVVGLAVFAILRRFARERLGWKLHRPQDPA
jgi:VanZ family protein